MHQLVIISFFDWEKKKKKRTFWEPQEKGRKEEEENPFRCFFFPKRFFLYNLFIYVYIHVISIRIILLLFFRAVAMWKKKKFFPSSTMSFSLFVPFWRQESVFF
jgi:hypothetical protein